MRFIVLLLLLGLTTACHTLPPGPHPWPPWPPYDPVNDWSRAPELSRKAVLHAVRTSTTYVKLCHDDRAAVSLWSGIEIVGGATGVGNAIAAAIPNDRTRSEVTGIIAAVLGTVALVAHYEEQQAVNQSVLDGCTQAP